LEKFVARCGIILMSLVGVALIAVYPLTRLTTAREYAELARTQEPLLSVPLEQLHTSRQGGFDVAIPIDAQWKRIEAQRGPAAFLIVAASNKYEAGRQTYALSSVGLALRVKRNGGGASLTPTRETPFGYSSYTPNNGFKFAADPGDRIHVDARLNTSTVPPRSVLLMIPSWSTWNVGEDLAVSAGVTHIMALAAAVAGFVFPLASVAFGLGRPAA
jgi:hypothetical protein